MSDEIVVGTVFMSGGKHGRLCTVVDIYKTYNLAGECVNVRYVSTHEFIGGLVTDYGASETEVRRGVWRLNNP